MKRGQKSEPSVRLLRVGESVRHALSEVFRRDMIRDAELAGVSITVTEANISPDLRNAKIFVQPLGGKNKDMVVTALNRNSSYLRGQLSTLVHLKYMPKLQFELDSSFDEADHITKLLNQPNVKRDWSVQEEDGSSGFESQDDDSDA